MNGQFLCVSEKELDFCACVQSFYFFSLFGFAGDSNSKTMEHYMMSRKRLMHGWRETLAHVSRERQVFELTRQPLFSRGTTCRCIMISSFHSLQSLTLGQLLVDWHVCYDLKHKAVHSFFFFSFLGTHLFKFLFTIYQYKILN